jgi:hypothetical protein
VKWARRQHEPLRGQWECKWYVLPVRMLAVLLEFLTGFRQASPLTMLPDGLPDVQLFVLRGIWHGLWHGVQLIEF